MDTLFPSIHALNAELALARGDRDQARRRSADAIASLDTGTQDRDVEVYTCIALGRLYREMGDLLPAENCLRRALATASEGNRTFGVSLALLALGPLYEQAGRPAQAARAYRAADRVHVGLDARRREQAVTALSRFRRSWGKQAEVQAAFREARGAPWTEIVARLLGAPGIEDFGE